MTMRRNGRRPIWAGSLALCAALLAAPVAATDGSSTDSAAAVTPSGVEWTWLAADDPSGVEWTRLRAVDADGSSWTKILGTDPVGVEWT